jgi:hypothetical protein
MTGITKVHGPILPADNLGGRDLQFIVIAQAGIHTNYGSVDSNFQKTIYQLQQFTELYMLGTPSSGTVTVGVAGDTLESAYSSSNGGSYPAIATAIFTATAVTTTVYASTLSGVAFVYGP